MFNRPAPHPKTMENLLLGGIALALAAYVFAAMLWPEKF
jgi:K+-transporting ATPase KdpF subunit